MKEDTILFARIDYSTRRFVTECKYLVMKIPPINVLHHNSYLKKSDVSYETPRFVQSSTLNPVKTTVQRKIGSSNPLHE